MPTKTNQPRFMIVDDSEISTRLYKKFLEKIGIGQITIHNDPLEAISDFVAKARAGTPFEGLLLDINMPKLTGFELLQRLEEEGIFGFKKIAVTAEDPFGINSDEFVAANFDATLRKPFLYESLAQVVQEVFPEVKHQKTGS